MRGRGRPATFARIASSDALSRRHDTLRAVRVARRRAQRRHRLQDVGEPAVHVAEPRDAGTFELLREVALRAVDDDQVRPQRQDPLDVGIEQRADARQRAHLRAAHRSKLLTATTRGPAPIANSISVAAGTREMMRVGRSAPAPSQARDSRDSTRTAVWTRRSGDERQSPFRSTPTHGWRTSSHRKNGPPMSAVTMPTGSSSGASAVRETRSHATRNAAPKPSDAGTTTPMVGPDEQPDEVRDDDADEADRPADRNGRARGKRRAEKRDALHAHDVDAARRGKIVAEREQVQRRRQRREDDERHAKHRQRHDQRPVAGDVQIAQQPPQRLHRLAHVREVLHEQDQRGEERVERDAGQQQDAGGEAAMPRGGQQIDHRHGRERAEEARGRDRGPRKRRDGAAHGDGEHRAERRARRDAERERRRQRVAEQRLEDDARRGQRRADQRGGEHARQPRDEEDLRVDVGRPTESTGRARAPG